MKFYDHLAETYDYFIQWEDRIHREDPFYQHLLRERLGTSILDLGCGSGGFSLHWADMGYNVVGIDSSMGMIKQAQNKAEAQEIDTEFACLPMTDFTGKLQQQFDAVICVGNNLAHILEPEPMVRVFQETIKSLRPSGVAVFHILNYQRILDNKRRDFPVKSHTVGEDEYLFIRFYNFLQDLLEFNMVVASKKEGQWTSRSMLVKHRPWAKGELLTLAKQAGFTDIMTYGNYQFEEFDPKESQDLILVCEVNEELDDEFEIYTEPKR
ncbi:MAG: class I SAM-dependent methyltransferase [bacterium]|jgi:2-polyprenyl-3-methyl-5-hydroxy-6-metoxy-1,4-benzoquinol methylase|nr:class I SAM-dependent methyltransferase [bacterium]